MVFRKLSTYLNLSLMWRKIILCTYYYKQKLVSFFYFSSFLSQKMCPPPCAPPSLRPSKRDLYVINVCGKSNFFLVKSSNCTTFSTVVFILNRYLHEINYIQIHVYFLKIQFLFKIDKFILGILFFKCIKFDMIL